MKSVKIAVDYDNTYTLDRSKWKELIFLMKSFGWDVRIFTYRFPDGNEHDLEPDLRELDIEVIYCSGKQKAHIAEAIGWVPDVWMDDSPETIVSYKDLCGFKLGCEANNEDSEFSDKTGKYKYYEDFKISGKY